MRLGLIAGAALVMAAPVLAGEAIHPRDDAQVLEHVAPSAKSQEERTLRARVAAAPQDPAPRVALARLLLQQGGLEADPRFTGRAQAALGPLFDAPAAPEDVRVLRATIRQRNHDFDAALKDLVDTANPQGVLLRASIHQTRGELADAIRDCRRLFGLADPLVATTCLAGVEGETAALEPARGLLARSVEVDGTPEHPAFGWALTTLAELDARSGDAASARRDYARARTVGAPQAWQLASEADFLLDQGDAPAVVTLLKDHVRADPLLLRLALAEAQTAAPEAAQHASFLRERFASARERGEAIHAREEARFVLELEHDPSRAVRLAQQDFEVQREPPDVRILLEAALAAHDAQAAAPALRFLEKTQLRDPRLDALRARLEVLR